MALEFSARPGGILADALQQPEFTTHLALFADMTQPLDLCYVSIHTYWIHNSAIPQRSLRLVRRQEPDGAWTQSFYLDDVYGGQWHFLAPTWLGLSRDPWHTRYYEAAPGTGGWVHRSDNGAEPHWQVTLIPLLHDYAGDMRPVV